MRTTLTIDDDVFAVAKVLAAKQGKTIGEVISTLARRSLEKSTRNGVPLLHASNHTPVTMEIVKQLSDEIG